MLCRPDREVYLEPRLVNLLRFLASNAGTVFGRDCLINEVWDGAEVTDQVVTQSIFELRKILKDGRNDAADYIVTVPKRGYKLVAPVRPLQVVSVVMAPAGNEVQSDLSPPLAEEDVEAVVTAAPFPGRPVDPGHLEPRPGWPQPLEDDRLRCFRRGDPGLHRQPAQLSARQPQVHSMLDPDLLVFRFHSGMDGSNENVRLADGITRALMGRWPPPRRCGCSMVPTP